MVNERIERLRELMKKNNVDIYYIPTSDYHDSEYVGPHFQCRAYMSGFTGSAGVMVVTLDEALLWSDGRYYIQAEKQTKDTCVTFMRQGEIGVINPIPYIQKTIKDGGCIGFDGRCVTAQFGQMIQNVAEAKDAFVKADVDFVNDIWNDRPELEKRELFVLETKYSGETYKSKLDKVKNKMKTYGSDTFVLSSLDDIAYFLNLRGRDIPSTPVFLSYLLVQSEKVVLFVDKDKINKEVQSYLDENAIEVCDYNEFFEQLRNIKNANVLIDLERANYTILEVLRENVAINNQENPTIMMKAIKNETEIANLRSAHIKDGVALTKFMYWLKTNIGKVAMNEYSVDDVLCGLRAEQEHYIETSFDSICAYNANGAMMHYKATEEQHAELKAEGILLVDSGGQYLEGTTDVTRTFALGAVDAEWKRNFTLVLRGMSTLSRAQFLQGCSGLNLDVLARQPLWAYGLDYKCGTGHGVGFLLGVHEGPHAFRWAKSPNRKEDTPLEAGMVITNEPGVYIEGSHGIRTENELIVRKQLKNGVDQFLGFETITFAPIDIDLIDKDYLDAESVSWLNAYHKEVFEKISPYLTSVEVTWLKEYTKEL